MTGIVTGGWEFVWAAYGITAAVLVAYGLRLAVGLRKGKEHDER